jgi:hypothetical protein
LLASGDDGEAVCYLCLDGGTDETDQPLRRDCACRGTDAGFVHLSCLAEYAETKSNQARDMNEFRDPWRACPSCHQKYQNDLAIDIATKFVSFVRRQYPDDTQRQVEALEVKMRAFLNMLWRLQSVQKREAGVTANVLLSLIDRMKTEVSPLPMRYSQFQAFACNDLGHIALNEGTEESARRAVVHFENAREVYEAIGDADNIVAVKASIAIAKSKYNDGNTEEVLKASKEEYEFRVSDYGDEDEHTIRAGKTYAVALQNANRGDEARELLTKLLATSKQTFGLHHNITKDIRLALLYMN